MNKWLIAAGCVFIMNNNYVYTEEPMKKFEILQSLERCYQALKPAQENNVQAFAWFSGLPHPLFNAVMHLSCEKDVEERIDALIAKAPPGSPLSFWVHAENHAPGVVEIIKTKGFVSAAKCPVMVWPVQPVPKPASEIRPANRKDFYQILSTVFHFDPVLKQQFEALLEQTKAENYMIYTDTLPITKAIGTATLLQQGKVGGIFNVAILPFYQKKGYGRSIMEFLMNRAQQLGLEYLVLLSSPEAEKMYLDLGFQKALDVEIYVR